MKPGDDTEGLQIALMRWATRSHSSAGLAGWDPYRLGPWLAGFMTGLHDLPWVDPGPAHASAREGHAEGRSERRRRNRLASGATDREPRSCETCRYRYKSSIYESHFHCLVYNGKAGRLARDRVRDRYLSVWKASGHVPTFDAIEECPEHEEGKPVCVEIGAAKDADHARRMRSMLADFWANVVGIDDKSIVIDIAGETVSIEVMP